MKLIFIVFTFFLFVGCSENKTLLDDFKRLEGTWIEEGEVKFTEIWKWENDTLINGSGKMTKGDETLFSEKLQLVVQNDSIFYIPNVSNQNKGKVIRFALISKSPNKWVFENKKHNFPTKISYTFKGDDSLTAVIEGIENGHPQKYIFRMKKAK